MGRHLIAKPSVPDSGDRGIEVIAVGDDGDELAPTVEGGEHVGMDRLFRALPQLVIVLCLAAGIQNSTMSASQ